MSTFKARGIVLKEISVGESDKILVLLLKERGKILASVRGGRNTNSKFLSSSQQFAYSDFVIHKGNNFYSIAQAQLIDSFYQIRNSFEQLCYANYFLEITEKTIMEEFNCDEILLLILKCLKKLEKNDICLEQIKAIFELKFLQYSGYMPEVYNCSICDCSFHCESKYYFGEYGIVCPKCINTNMKLTGISNSTLYTITYILEQDINNLFSFKSSGQINFEMAKAIGIFLKHHFPIKLNSLELYGLSQ